MGRIGTLQRKEKEPPKRAGYLDRIAAFTSHSHRGTVKMLVNVILSDWYSSSYNACFSYYVSKTANSADAARITNEAIINPRKVPPYCSQINIVVERLVE